MVQRFLSMLPLISSCLAEEILWNMRGSGTSPVRVMTPSLVEALQKILVSLKIADSVMPLCLICGTPCLSAPTLPISVPSGPEDAESHRNLHRHGAAIPGSLILHLFSIRPVRFVLTSLLLVLFVIFFCKNSQCQQSSTKFHKDGAILKPHPSPKRSAKSGVVPSTPAKSLREIQ